MKGNFARDMNSMQRILIATLTFLAILAIPASGEIVYTPVNVGIGVDGHYHIDLNGDGITDFNIKNTDGNFRCGAKSFYYDKLVISHSKGNNVADSGSWAAALAQGVEVGPSLSFGGSGMMSYYATGWQTEFGGCESEQIRTGRWIYVGSAYLGVEFLINGEIHYGWIASGGGLTPTVTGFAYETVPNQSIVTGQTTGP